MRGENVRNGRHYLLIAQILVGCLVFFQVGLSVEAEEHWVGTWATAVVEQVGIPGVPESQGPSFTDQTLRQIVRVSLGGGRVRVVFSNTFGTMPLEIGAAQVARRVQDSTIVGESRRSLTFSGKSSVVIPAGSVIFSDPASLIVPALSELAIDLYLPGDTATSGSPITTHIGSFQTNYLSTSGNHIQANEFPVEAPLPSWFFLSRVEVEADEGVGAVVVLGDSITDGTGSTSDTNNRWPDHLARRLHEANIPMGVLNLGIAGNRVLSDGAGVSALARFDREVLAQTGATHVVVMEGINDVGLARNELGLPRSEIPPTAAEIIAGHQQIVARAKAQGLKVYGATLTPFEGTAIPVVPDYWTPEGESTRQAVNDWIRSSGAYDAVIDFDAAVQNPAAPTEFLPEYDSGDHLHPGDTGYEAMARAVDLELLK